MSDMASWCAEQEQREAAARESFLQTFGEALAYARKKRPDFVRRVMWGDKTIEERLALARGFNEGGPSLLGILHEEALELCEALLQGDLARAREEAAHIAAVAARAVGPEGECLLGTRQGEDGGTVVTGTMKHEKEMAQCRATTQPRSRTQGHAESKPTLPKWCKLCAWVFCGKALAKIVALDLDEEESVAIKIVGDDKRILFAPTDLRPARFRLPTLNEAYGLLGKVMETEDGTRQLICIVGEDNVTGDDMGTERMLFINRTPAECLMFATIDGVPFGIPVVDEETEKEENK